MNNTSSTVTTSPQFTSNWLLSVITKLETIELKIEKKQMSYP